MVNMTGNNRLTAEERETVINMDDSSDYALITTYQRTLVTKLRKNPSAEVVWHNGLGGWQFKVPAKLVNIRMPRVQTEESKARVAAKMAKARAAREK